MDDLLKEAIADAKAVRDTALANAKIALQEAFTPKIQSMLSQKIQSEVEGQDEEEVEEQEEEEVEEQSDSSEIGASDNKVNAADSDDEEDPQGPGAVTEEEHEDDVEEQEAEELEEQEEEEVEEQEEEEVEEQEEEEVEEYDELDLEAILRELEEDEDELEEDEDELEESEEEDKLLAAADALAPDVPLDGEEVEEQEEEELEEQEEEELEEDEEEIEEDEEIDLEEILRELSEEDEEEVEEDTEASQGDVSKLQNELEEHRSVVKYLRSKLNEVNLLNAKLLFTNKLFRAYGLSNEQKLRVVETFDRARNLREVKLVFSTLAESFKPNGVDKPTIKENKGTASKPVASTKPKSKKVITEGSKMKDRFQKLANIL